MLRINTTALRAFLLWGYRHSPNYFTAEQVEYLGPGVVMPRPALAGTPAPSRRTRTRRVGQSGDYIEDEDAPSAAQVVALGEALATSVGTWGRLALVGHKDPAALDLFFPEFNGFLEIKTALGLSESN